MNTISILRIKGLTDADIMGIISERQAKQLQEAYMKGFREGVAAATDAFMVATDCVEYVKQTDLELSCCLK